MTKATLLIVESDATLAGDLAGKLRSLEYEVCGTARDGASGIQLAREGRPQLVLVDIRLKGRIDGIQTAAQIRQESDVPVLFLSAPHDVETRDRATALGPAGYVLQPHGKRELEAAIDAALHAHQATRRARQSEERLAATVAAIPDAIVSTDETGHIRFLNPAAERMFGASASAAIGGPLEQFLPGSNQKIRATQQTGAAAPLELSGRRADGTEFPVEATVAHHAFAGEGTFTLSLRDVAGQRHVQSQLTREREVLAYILGNMPVMVCIQYPALREWQLNHEFERVLGWNAEDCRHPDFMQRLYPDAATRARAVANYESGDPAWHVLRPAAKDGTPVESCWASLRVSDHMRVAIGFDLRERRRAEDDLREARVRAESDLARWKSFFDHLPIGMLAATTDGQTVYANPAWQRLHGCPATGPEAVAPLRPELDRTTERSWQLHDVSGAELAPALRPLARARQPEGFQDQVLRVRKSDGTIGLVASYSGAPVGQTGLVVVTARDVARQTQERHRLERHLCGLTDALLAAGAAYFEHDADLSTGWLGEGFADALGYDPEALPEFAQLRAWLDERIHPDDRARAADVYAAFLAGRSPFFDVECRSRAADGAWRWIRILRAATERDELGRVTYIAGLLIDDTARKLPEESVRASEGRLRAAIEGAAIGIGFTDPDGRLRQANAPLLALTGRAPADLAGPGISWHTLFAPGQEPIVERIDAALDAQGRFGPEETECARPDGSRVPILLAAVRLPGKSAERALFLIDIAERRRVEDALRRSEARLELAIENAGLGVYDQQFDPPRVLWSERLLEIVGLPEAPDAGWQSWIDRCVHPEDRPRVARAMQTSLDPRGDGVLDDEHRLVLPDGAVRWVHLRGRTFFTSRGDTRRPARVVGVVDDITTRKLTEIEMLAAQDRLGALLDSVGDPMLTVDDQWRYDHVNAAAAHLLARTPEELAGESLWETPAGVWSAPFEHELRRARERGAPVIFEARCEALGTWLECRCHPTPTGLTLLFADIGARKQAEAALDAARLEAVRASQTTRAEAERALEQARAEAAQTLESTRADAERALEQARAEAAQTLESTRADAERALQSAREIAQETLRVHVEAAEEALRASREAGEREVALWKAIVEHIPEGVLVADANGQALCTNPAWQQFHGCPATGRDATAPVLARRNGLGASAWQLRDVDGGVLPPELWPLARVQRAERFEARVLRVRRSDGTLEAVGSYAGAPVAGTGLGVVTVRDVAEQTRTRQALEQSWRRLTDTLLAAGGTYFEHDAGLTTGWLGEGFAGALGYDPEALPEFPHLRAWLDERIHPDDRARAADVYAAFLAGRRPFFDIECRSRAADGAWRWIHILRAATERDELGRVTYIAGLLFDVTARKQPEESVRANEGRLRAAIEGAALGIGFTDPDGRLRQANPPLLALAGRAPADLAGPGISWRTLLGPGQEALAERIDAALDAQGRFGPEETECARPDGSRVPILLAAARLPGEGAERALFLIDIAERRRVEDTLRQNEARLQLAVENAGLGLYDQQFDPPRTIWSERLRDLTQLTGDPGAGWESWINRCVHPEDRPRVARAMQTSLDPRGDGVLDDEHRLVLPDGVVRWVHLRGRTFFTGRGDTRRVARIVGVVSDITARKLAEIEMLAARDRLGALLEGVGDPMVTVDGLWRYDHVNAAAAHLLAHTPEQLAGESLWQTPAGVWSAPFERELRRARERGAPVIFEARCEALGTWLECRCHPTPTGLTLLFADIGARKQAEAALDAARLEAERQAARWHAVLEQMPDGVLVAAPDGDALLANAAWRHFHGCAGSGREAAAPVLGGEPGSWALDDIDAGPVPETLWPLTRALRAERFSGQVLRARNARAGIELVASYSGAPVEDENLFVVTALDATAPTRVRLDLEQARRNIDTAMRVADAAYIEHDAALSHGRVDEGLARVLGYAPQDVPGFPQIRQWIEEQIHPDDRRRVAAAYRQFVAGRTPCFDEEYRSRTAEGAWRWIRTLRTATRRAPDGRVASVVGLVYDIDARKLAEEQLRASETRLRTLIEGARVGIALADATGRLSQANESFLAAAGCGAGDLAHGAIAWPALLAPGTRDIEARVRAELDAGGGSSLIETRLARPDGVLVPVILSAVALPGAEGEHAVLLVDIAERRAREDALAQSEERMRLALAAAQLGALEWTVADDRLTPLNACMLELCGGAPATEAPRTRIEFVRESLHPDDIAAFNAALDDAMRGGSPFHSLCRSASGTDGTPRWIEFSGRFHPGQAGASGRLICTVADISARRRAEDESRRIHAELEDRFAASEAALREAEDRFQALSDASQEMVLITRDRHPIHVNRQSEPIAGCAPAALLVPRFDALRLFDPESIERARALLERDGRGGGPESGEVAILTPDNRRVEVFLSTVPVQYRGGAATLATFADRSVRRDLERRLDARRTRCRQLAGAGASALDAEVDRICAALTQGLARPLESSLGKLSQLRILSSEAHRAWAVSEIDATLQQAQQLIRQLTVEFSTATLERDGLEPALGEICDALSKRHDARFNFHGEGRRVPLPPEAATALLRATRELLLNVARHSGAKSASVTLDTLDEQVRVTIKDRGRGFTLEPDADGNPALAGFGLPAIEERLRAVGGRVEIESGAGQGTTVSLWLPLPSSPERSTRAATTHAPDAGRGPRATPSARKGRRRR